MESSTETASCPGPVGALSFGLKGLGGCRDAGPVASAPLERLGVVVAMHPRSR